MISERRTRTTAEAACRARVALLVLSGPAAGREVAAEPDVKGATPFETKVRTILAGRPSPGNWTTYGWSGGLVP